ncbi:MAG: Gfo/Idh/MocA family oxidoreductase [Pseudomonadota bacterium]
MKRKHVNIAVVGAGYWGRNYVRNLAVLPEVNLVWVCDLDEQARIRAAQIAPDVRTTTDLQQVLKDQDVEAVVVATNSTFHYEHSLAALRADKHVLVEKPLATSLSQAEELVKFARSSGRTLMVGHLMLYHPAVERLREMVKANELGRLYYISALRVNLGRVRSDENVLWSFAPHDLSMILHLLGRMPKSVSARGQDYLQPGIEDVVFVDLVFGGQEMVHIQLSWLDSRKERRLSLVGSRKMVIFDDTHVTEKLRVYDKAFDRPPEYDSYGDYLSIRGGDIHIPRLSMVEPLVEECRHFVRCLTEKIPCRSDAEQGLQVVRILDAAERSMKNGGIPVEL